MNLESSHPYWFVRNVIERELYATSIQLSHYRYTPQTLLDERTDYSVARDFFLDPGLMLGFMESCPSDQDVAINSIVRMQNGETLHLPMIDMFTPSKAHLQKLIEFIGRNLFFSFAWFASGRSFHGYGGNLITHSEWIKFMGTLLLSNQKDLKPTVDPRWIGHRLIAGYSSLRWTKNTSHYLGIPVRVA